MPDLRRPQHSRTSPANIYKPASIAYNAVFPGKGQDKASRLPLHLRFTEQIAAASHRQTVQQHQRLLPLRMQDSVRGCC